MRHSLPREAESRSHSAFCEAVGVDHGIHLVRAKREYRAVMTGVSRSARFMSLTTTQAVPFQASASGALPPDLTAVHARADAHDTLQKAARTPGACASSDHPRPFQPSTSGSEPLQALPDADAKHSVPAATAVHATIDEHETDISAPTPGGAGNCRHRSPFQRSTSVC